MQKANLGLVVGVFLGLALGVMGTIGVQRSLTSDALPAEQGPARKAPRVIRIDPQLGPPGQWVHVEGKHFVLGKTLVSVGGVEGIQPGNEHDNHSLGFEVPADAEGTTTVRITTPAGSGESYAQFTVGMPTHPPSITRISPASGPPGQWVYVDGTGFVTGQTTVTYGNVARIPVLVYRSNGLGFHIPEDASASGAVIVTTPGGSATSAAEFRLTN